MCEITQKSSDNVCVDAHLCKEEPGASAVFELSRVPGQVMLAACLSAAAEPGHLLGCVCVLTTFFVRFCRVLTIWLRCWVLLGSAAQDSAAVLCSHLLFSAF